MQRKTVIRARLLGQRGIELNINTQHFKFFIIYLFLAVLGLPCCWWAFSGCSEQGLRLAAVHGLLIVVASLVTEPGSRRVGSSSCSSQAPEHSTLAVALGLSCSATCGIFPVQGSNLCLPRWQVDSLPLSHQGNPNMQHFYYSSRVSRSW